MAALIAILIWGGRGGAPEPGADTQHAAVIAAQPFAVSLGVAGVVAPGPTVPVVAPFDAVAKRVDVVFGEAVEKGQPLLELDTGDLAQRRDAANAEYLKAAQSAADLANWSAGAEVAQSRRAQAQAAMDLSETHRKIDQTAQLLRRGLVAREEYDGLLQQRQSQELALAAAGQEAAETLKRGTGANLRAAELDARGAGARLAEITGAGCGGGDPRARGGGGRSAAERQVDAGASAPRVGQSFGHGQMVAAIAPPGNLSVTFSLDEADANRIRPGQRVTVTGPGFQGQSLAGAVASVAREATPASAGGGVTFAAVASLDPLTPAQAAVVRIGMTAAVSIDLYRNPAAVVAPAAAIQGATPDTFVLLQPKPGGPTSRRPVRIGQVGPLGVEVLSG